MAWHPHPYRIHNRRSRRRRQNTNINDNETVKNGNAIVFFLYFALYFFVLLYSHITLFSAVSVVVGIFDNNYILYNNICIVCVYIGLVATY